jgi:hypothetical protein
MKKNYKYILIVLTILAIGTYFLINNLKNNFMQGERHSGLDDNITYELLDSVKVGLERYKAIYGQYPNYSGKYFFDSIKTLLTIPDTYVYADSINESGKIIPIKKFAGKSFDYLTVPHTYLAVGNKDLFIIYKYISNNSYKLYTVGENCIDENGKGDDISIK